MQSHKVKQGETIPSIAMDYGFRRWQAIYYHAGNLVLREKRTNPNMLVPGDLVVIPDKALMEVSAGTEQRHKFIAKGSPSWLRIVVNGFDGEPLKNTKYKLEIVNRTFEGTTDGKGLLEQKIPADAGEGTLRIADWVLPLNIGQLHPIEIIAGWWARLYNLGYISRPLKDNTKEDVTIERCHVKSAIEQFQGDNYLKVDGIMGPKSQSKLEEVYGC